MKSNEVVPAIIALCKDRSLSFPQKTASIAGWLTTCPVATVLEHLDDAGIIPECFGHDSTEENSLRSIAMLSWPLRGLRWALSPK